MNEKKMMWYAPDENTRKILYVYENGWKPYHQSSLAVGDYAMAGTSLSSGYATMQKLLKLDWTLLPSQTTLP